MCKIAINVFHVLLQNYKQVPSCKPNMNRLYNTLENIHFWCWDFVFLVLLILKLASR